LSGSGTAATQTIREKCLVDAAEASQDPVQERTALQCVQSAKAAERAAREKKLAEQKESAALAKELEKAVGGKTPTPDNNVVKQVPNGPPIVGLVAPLPPNNNSSTKTHGTPDNSPAQPSVGTTVYSSAYTTPNACSKQTIDAANTASGTTGMVSVHRELMTTHDASDNYGRRLGRRYLVYQVTVTNDSKDFQYQVSDIVVDLKTIFNITGTPVHGNHAKYQASSMDLTMLRGIPEKGQDYDPRNMTLHIFQGLGAVGAAVSGLTPVSDVMGGAMADFNGAFIQAFTGIAPDHTANQLNRLSDRAFASGTLIGKLQTRVFAVFIPEPFVLHSKEVSEFHSNPRKLLDWLPLDQVNVCVDGILLVQVDTTPDPVFSTNESYVKAGTTITLTDSGADIYATINGDTPTTNSAKYTTAYTVGDVGTPALTVKAFALAPNKAPSNVVIHTFTPAKQAATPTIKPGSDPNTLIITPGNGEVDDAIFYTTDGTTPTRTSKQYSASTPVPAPVAGTKITAIAVGATTAFSDPATYTVPTTSAPQ
jgi:hypothetical protein